jgi:cell division protein FtsI (penicillin-binding protein 3)
MPGNANKLQLFNRYSLGVYEFGSIMKVITLAMGLDSRKVNINDAYDLTAMQVSKFNIKDYHKEHGWHSVPEIFIHSSNIGMAQIMLETGKETLKHYIDALGMNKRLNIEIPEKGIPLIPRYESWTDLSLATMSYGYGMSISPLHFINATIPIVNGGIKYPLHFVKKNDDIIGEKVLSEDTSSWMKKLLRLTVTKGTGKKSDVKGYVVGAKTGTAQKREGKNYVKNKRDASFFAIFPSHDPKFVVLIMLDNPQPTKETFGFATAGWTAAPMAKSIISRIVTLYGLPQYDDSFDEIINDELIVEVDLDGEV